MIKVERCCVCAKTVFAEDTSADAREMTKGARQYYSRWYCGPCYDRSIVSGFNPETASYDMEVE